MKIKLQSKSLCLCLLFGCLIPNQAFGYQPEPEVVDKPVPNKNRLFQLEQCRDWYLPKEDSREYKGASRIVVKVLSDGSALLNPQENGQEMPNTVPLESLTLDTATHLWGKLRGGCFDLLAHPRIGNTDFDIYHMDVKFVDGKLSSYRLRGIDIKNPSWKSVKK